MHGHSCIHGLPFINLTYVMFPLSWCSTQVPNQFGSIIPAICLEHVIFDISMNHTPVKCDMSYNHTFLFYLLVKQTKILECINLTFTNSFCYIIKYMYGNGSSNSGYILGSNGGNDWC